jgi:hypothetical protein
MEFMEDKLYSLSEGIQLISWELVLIITLFIVGMVLQYGKMAKATANVMMAASLVRKRKLTISVLDVMRRRKPLTDSLSHFTGWRGIHGAFWLFHNGKKDEQGKSILHKVSMVLEWSRVVSLKKDNQNLYVKDFQIIYDQLLAKGWSKQDLSTPIPFIRDALHLHNQKYNYFFMYKEKDKPLFVLSIMTKIEIAESEIDKYIKPELSFIHSIFDNALPSAYQECINYYQ